MHGFQMDAVNAKLVAAATGSTLTALTMTPFDVVKTRLQTQPPAQKRLFPRPPPNTCCQPGSVVCVRNMSSLARAAAAEDLVCIWDHGFVKTERVNGFFDAFRHVWRAEGIRGLWKGSGTTLLIGVPSSTAYMMAYDYLVHSLLPPLIQSPLLVPLASGIIARTTITTVASPLELIRTNLQSTPLSGTTHSLRSVLISLRDLARSRGAGSLWRGLGPTLWRDVPFSGLYWAGYESCKQAFARRHYEGAAVAFVSGAFSGVSAALITSPFDVLKTRRQSLLMSTSNAGLTRTFPLLKQIVTKEGFSALYAGLVPRITKIAPACGIMIASFEGVGKYLSRT